MTTRAAVPRGKLDRPLGAYPRGTSLGFVGLVALAVGVPFFGLQTAAPVIPGGFGLWLGSIPVVLAFALLPTFVLIAGLRSHRYWVICLFFYFGAGLLAAYAVVLPLALAVVAGAFPAREAGLHAMSVVGLILLAALAPAAWCLLRTMRLRYWQPGSAAGTWEPGDETAPTWAMSRERRG